MADNTVQEIKERIDVADVIGEYVHLRRAGTNLKGLCPFHSEKTPSFMVNRDRGVWRCFGCGEGGDVFAFLQKHESLTFPETLKILADKAGVKLPERQVGQNYDREAQIRDELLQINELAARFYHEALLRSKSGEVAREYLNKRGLSEETIKKWQLGFAPDDWHQLENFLVKKGFAREKMVQAGLLVRNQGQVYDDPRSGYEKSGGAAATHRKAAQTPPTQGGGRTYDRFRFRITFPLVDHHGRIVGFTARALGDEDGAQSGSPSAAWGKAKYINSPETSIYHKGRMLYGYYFAKKAVRQADKIVMVEGNMDCISSQQAGVENVAASSGTALTPDQLSLISRLTKNLIFAFDTDKAGLAATRRGLELALASGFTVRIAEIKDKDPDQLIRSNPKAWREVIDTAPNFLDFSYKSIFGKVKDSDRESLRDAAKQYLEIVVLLNDSIAQAQEAKRVAERLDVPVESILEFLKKQKSKSPLAAAPRTPSLKAKSRRQLLEERILGLSLVNEEFKTRFSEILSPSDFSTVAVTPDFVITQRAGSQENSDQISMLTFLGEEEWARLKEQDLEQNKLGKVFTNLCQELKALSIREQMQKLSREISMGEKNKDENKLSELRTEFNRLAEQLTTLMQG